MKLALLIASAAVASAIVPVSVYGPESEQIKGEYVVQFSDYSAYNAYRAKMIAGTTTFDINNDFFGFAGKLTQEQLFEVQRMPGVALIEPNMKFHALGVQTNVQAWGIDRSDQRALPLDTIFRWDDNADGTGTRVFILDTGVDTNHPDFQGRAFFAADCTSGNCNTGNNPGDPHGHGTHCAGSVGARLYGIAKNTTLHNIRVLGANGSGSTQGIINGINFVTNLAGNGKVISMSLGGGFSTALNNAVDASHRAGVVNVVAAGNSNNNACNASPASAALALTVAASDRNDVKASFSSFGTCVDIWGPGVGILSTAPGGGTAVFSGTSMACPHVAGAVAQVISRGVNDPNAIVAIITNDATPNVIQNNPAGTPNLLLNTFPNGL